MTGLLIFPILPAARAGACSSTTDYSDYVAGGFSCTVSTLTFSNFSLGAGSNLAANQITVAQVVNGLQFSYTLSTTSMQVSEQDLNIGFDVAESTLGIGSAGLSFTGNGGDAGVTASVTENFAGGPLNVFQTNSTGSDLQTQNDQKVALNEPASLTVTESSVVKTIATGAARTASISSMTDTFIPSPEPGTIGLVALSIAGLIAAKYVRRGGLTASGTRSAALPLK